jgi:hypothetical protein
MNQEPKLIRKQMLSTCVKLLEVEHIVDEEGEIIDDDVMRAIGAVLKHVMMSKDSVQVVSLLECWKIMKL